MDKQKLMKDYREELLYTMIGTEESVFTKQRFNETETNDHEHCSICFAKISEDKEDVEFGYYCESSGDWLCSKCFNDFRIRFRWLEKEE